MTKSFELNGKGGTEERKSNVNTKMSIECALKPLQRELADTILRAAPLDDLRILLACGASPNEPVTQG